MADYLVLIQNANAWSVVNLSSNKKASPEGECAAIVESFNGPGKYVALRIDNAQVMDVTVEPKLTEVEKVEEPPAPVEEPVEEPPVDPVAEPVAVDPVEAPVEEPVVEPTPTDVTADPVEPSA